MTKQRSITAAFMIAIVALTFVFSCVFAANRNVQTPDSFLDRFNQPVWESIDGEITMREYRNTALGRSYIELEIDGKKTILDVR